MKRKRAKKAKPAPLMALPPGWAVEKRGEFVVAVACNGGEEIIIGVQQKRCRAKVQPKRGRPVSVAPSTRRLDARAVDKAMLEIMIFRDFGRQHAQPSVRQAVAAAVNEQFPVAAKRPAAEERVRKVVRRLLADRAKSSLL